MLKKLFIAQCPNYEKIVINYFLASGDFCRLLIAFPNRLSPDQDQQNFGPDLDLNCFFFKKLILKKVSSRQQKHEKSPSRQRFNVM